MLRMINLKWGFLSDKIILYLKQMRYKNMQVIIPNNFILFVIVMPPECKQTDSI